MSGESQAFTPKKVSIYLQDGKSMKIPCFLGRYGNFGVFLVDPVVQFT